MEFSFNAQEQAQAEDQAGGPYSLLERGDYPLVIVASELKTTRKGDGEYLKIELEAQQVEMEVAQGHPRAGAKVWSNFNTQNPSAKAVEIGMQQLTRLVSAVGMQGFTHESELRGKSFMAEVVIEKSKNPAYEDSNRIYGFRPMNSESTQQQPAQATGNAWDS